MSITMSQTKTYKGSCLCGGIHYQISEPFKVFQYCHCSRCQKVTGSGFAPNVFVPLEQFKWLAGEELLGRYEIPDAKYFATSFCKNCGSTMPWLTKTGTIYILPVGTLDDKFAMQPSQSIFTDEIPPWHTSFDQLPKRPQGPRS